MHGRLVNPPERWGLQAAKDDLRRRQEESARWNARLLLVTVISQEMVLDASIRRADTWSDKWWMLLASADKLRRRRIELEAQAKD